MKKSLPHTSKGLIILATCWNEKYWIKALLRRIKVMNTCDFLPERGACQFLIVL